MSETNPPTWDPDAIDWEEVARVRKMTGIERVIASLRLQEMGRKMSMQGIRREHPEADEAEVMRLYRERLALCERLESLW